MTGSIRIKYFSLAMGLILFGLNLFGQNPNASPCESCKELSSKKNFTTEVDESIPFLKKDLFCFKEGKCWEDYINSLNSISVAYYNKRDYLEAQNYAQQAMEFSLQHFGKKSNSYATSIANLAVFILAVGNYKKSIQYQLQSLKLEELLGTNNEVMAIAFENLGITYQRMGNSDLALYYFDKTLELSPRISTNTGIENQHTIGRLFRQKAACFWTKKELEKALIFYKKSLAILKQLPKNEYYQRTLWYAYRDLAEVYLEQKNLALASFYIRKTLEIQEQFNMLEAYKAYTTMGDIHLLNNHLEDALIYFQKADEVAKWEYRDYQKHPGLAIPIARQAKVYAHKKEYQLALDHYDQALQLISHNVDEFTHPLEALNILEDRANLQHDQYMNKGKFVDLEKAFFDYQNILQILQSIRQNYFSNLPKYSFAERIVSIMEHGISTSLELHRISGKTSYLEKAFLFAESNKAGLFSELLQEEIAKGYAGIPESLLEREEELGIEISFLQKAILEAKQKKKPEDLNLIQKWERKVFELEIQHRERITNLEEQYPLYYSRKHEIEPVSLRTLRQQMPNDKTALIEFMVGQKNSYSFFITKENIKVYQLKKSADLIENIDEMRKLISTPLSGGKYKETYKAFIDQSTKLYQELLKKGLEDLTSNVEHLIIIPDDYLYLLPFELLLRQAPVSDRIDYSLSNLNYLLEDYAISYHYSASLMATLKSRHRQNRPTETFIGFAPSFKQKGVAQYRTCSEDNLIVLQCNQKEVQSAQVLVGGEVILAEEARLDIFQQKIQEYQIIHLATHACIDEEFAALSKIYFSDSYLTPFELNNLRLKADLTVLSACNTGSGKVLKGEGVMSLSRSFLLAGSQSVLTSLWSVNDCATLDLMTHFYEGLKKGLPTDKALKEAKLNYLKNADINGRHPSFWAAFVAFGDMKKIALPQKNNFFLLKTVGLILLLIFFLQLFRN